MALPTRVKAGVSVSRAEDGGAPHQPLRARDPFALVIFGVPNPSAHDAAAALACAVALVEDVRCWNIEVAAEGQKPLDVSAGIHYGPVVMARLGGETQAEMTAAGDTVNVETGVRGSFSVGNKLLTVQFQEGSSITQQADSLDPTRRSLVVFGTFGNDSIKFEPGDDKGVRVEMNNLPRGTFLPNGRLIASAGYDQTVCLWEVATGKKLGQFSEQAPWVAFSADSKTLVTFNERLSLWATTTAK